MSIPFAGAQSYQLLAPQQPVPRHSSQQSATHVYPMPGDRFISNAEVRQAVAASRQMEQRDTTTEKVLAVSIVGGLIAGVAILGDSIRRWGKSKPHAHTKQDHQPQHGCTHECP